MEMSPQEMGHYEGQPTSASASSSLANVFGNGNVSEEASWPTTFHTCCLWWGSDEPLQCFRLISRSDVPEHFRAEHRMEGMEGTVKICCQWSDCGEAISLHHLIWHIREIHLG